MRNDTPTFNFNAQFQCAPQHVSVCVCNSIPYLEGLHAQKNPTVFSVILLNVGTDVVTDQVLALLFPNLVLLEKWTGW